MPSKYKISDDQSLHFLTFAVVEWIDTMTRPLYKDILIESLCYCIKEKGLRLYAYVILTNHVHMIAAAKEGYKLSDILRDFKKFTSKKVISEIEENVQESRKNWMLWIFKAAGKNNSNNKNHQFWQQDNRPIQLSTNEMIEQRLEYIHMNPVIERIVEEPEHYIYSSAGDYARKKGLVPIEFIDG